MIMRAAEALEAVTQGDVCLCSTPFGSGCLYDQQVLQHKQTCPLDTASRALAASLKGKAVITAALNVCSAPESRSLATLQHTCSKTYDNWLDSHSTPDKSQHSKAATGIVNVSGLTLCRNCSAPLATGSRVRANLVKGEMRMREVASSCRGPACRFMVTSSSVLLPYIAYPATPACTTQQSRPYVQRTWEGETLERLDSVPLLKDGVLVRGAWTFVLWTSFVIHFIKNSLFIESSFQIVQKACASMQRTFCCTMTCSRTGPVHDLGHTECHATKMVHWSKKGQGVCV